MNSFTKSEVVTYFPPAADGDAQIVHFGMSIGQAIYDRMIEMSAPIRIYLTPSRIAASAAA